MEIIPFCYGGHEVRMMMDEGGNPWWVAKDVCDILEYSNPSKTISDHLDEDERSNKSLDRGGSILMINESGLYALILRSNKPQAKPFRKWVTSEVLPSIRKTGTYIRLNDMDQEAFYRTYETLNPNSEFIIEFQGVRVSAFVDVNHGFLITTGELARIMGVSSSTLRVLKKYHRDKLKGGIHCVELGQREYWTRKGAGWIGLHNRDGSFGRYLLDGGLDRQLETRAELLRSDGEALLRRFEAMEASNDN